MPFPFICRLSPAFAIPPLSKTRLRRWTLASAALLGAWLWPSIGRSCACGCGIYELGTSSMLPTGSGAMTFLDYDYQDQSRNWSGDSRAPSADNADKDIRTSFVTYGVQDLLTRTWGVRVDVPYESRFFETTGGASGSDLVRLNYRGFGDVRIEGIYTGFSPDLSTGLTCGLKLPSGSFTTNDAYGDVDRDTEIGSGSTDLFLGAFKRLNFGMESAWSGFLQALMDLPLLTQDQYRPGAELDGALGFYYNGWSAGRMRISPTGQLKASVRGRDGGAQASQPVASGYERVILAAGFEADLRPIKAYADVEAPVYQRFTGNQLAASIMFRFGVSYLF